jgi:hypothetical protein
MKHFPWLGMMGGQDILNQSHQQSVGGVFLVHHKSLQSTRSKPVTGELILLEIPEWFSLMQIQHDDATSHF